VPTHLVDTDIFHWINENSGLLVAQQEKSGHHYSLFIFWTPWISEPHVIEIHPIVVEIFQFGPKWWTNIATPSATSMAKNKPWVYCWWV